MSSYKFEVVVETDNLEDAVQVLVERLGYDEDYGFEYTVDCDYIGWEEV